MLFFVGFFVMMHFSIRDKAGEAADGRLKANLSECLLTESWIKGRDKIDQRGFYGLNRFEDGQ